MHSDTSPPPATTLRSAVMFLAIGLALYVAAFAVSERLAYRAGHDNPFFKIATTDRQEFDWVILGASHAMPFDFAGVNASIETGTGQRILNLAGPGTGPLYNRFVLEQFLQTHRTASVLYVADSFAFQSRSWNEDRFLDSKLLGRTPLDASQARRLLRYVVAEGVDVRALLDYVTGFSKVNDRDRLKPDIWEGAAQFDRVNRPSAVADAKRIAYLYPDAGGREAAMARYLDVFAALIDLARQRDIRVTVIKLPVPPQFYAKLPDEAAFDAGLANLLASKGVQFADFSSVMAEPRFYFDSDHLNRQGVEAFVKTYLNPILAGQH
jgi:hypothetical protein